MAGAPIPTSRLNSVRVTWDLVSRDGLYVAVVFADAFLVDQSPGYEFASDAVAWVDENYPDAD